MPRLPVPKQETMMHSTDDKADHHPLSPPVKKAVSRRIIGKYYILTHIIKESDKGNIYQAVSLKNFSFRSCVIKQGKPGMLLDKYERDMKDRLLWQKEVLFELGSTVPTPSCIDYFEDKGYSYLVLQYVEGKLLYTAVTDIFTASSWPLLSAQKQQQLLKLYGMVLDIVADIQFNLYVHRDITDSNFILLNDGRLCILDFELSYSTLRGQPKPAFKLGTLGYMSPEQVRNSKPDYPQDIYSLGALLSFILTKTPPKDFLKADRNKRKIQLKKITDYLPVNNLLIECLSGDPSRRPKLEYLKDTISGYIKHLSKLTKR
jgi:serine/threonine protein kinase